MKFTASYAKCLCRNLKIQIKLSQIKWEVANFMSILKKSNKTQNII